MQSKKKEKEILTLPHEEHVFPPSLMLAPHLGQLVWLVSTRTRMVEVCIFAVFGLFV
jgi:hypothetical protein